MPKSTAGLVSAGLFLAVAAASAGQQHDHGAGSQESGQNVTPAPLLIGLGHLHHPITTSSPLAQRYFDQGLTLVYGFNHEEAARSFGYVATLDPKCAMAHWGVALARGPNYNESEIDAGREKTAAEAVKKAEALAAGSSAREQAYIRALAKRLSTDPKADQKKLGASYRDAMRKVMRSYPDDLDAAVLFADAAMSLHAWMLWKPDGKPEKGTKEAVQALESVLKRDPDNIGANHFYIHAVEGSPHPEQAMASARKLASLAPGAGHLVHMPAHIYIRTGDYHAASVSNKQAMGSDQGYIDKYHVDGMYAMMYYTHNMHFLAVTSSMEGDFAGANRVAAHITQGLTPMMKEHPEVQMFLPTQTFVLVRFRRWSEIEQLPEPDKSLAQAHAVWRFARGMAFSSEGKTDQADAERSAFAAEVKAIPAKEVFGYNTAAQIFDIASRVFDANIARSRRDYNAAEVLLTLAAQAEDALHYDEPPDWYLPPRESLGAVLFLDGRPSEAEAVFRAELKAHPKNPRALFGLAECERAQGNADQEAAIRKDFEAGWKHADTHLRMEDL
jgi:tetratricopeptide (TPR) repeat protein